MIRVGHILYKIVNEGCTRARVLFEHRTWGGDGASYVDILMKPLLGRGKYNSYEAGRCLEYLGHMEECSITGSELVEEW